MLHAAVDGCCLDAYLAQVVHLVLHQRNEWRHYNANTFHGHCWYLEGDAFAATGGHQS